MKRGNDGEKIMGPMFPRLHVNDADKGGPRAPPRNKMALYEQLSIPSQRFSHAVPPHNRNNNMATSVPKSSLSGGNDRGAFSARQVHRAYPYEIEKQYRDCSELSAPLAQVKQRKKIDEDDYAVPVFIQPKPSEFENYSKEKLSPSNPPYLHPSLKSQLSNEIEMLEISIGREGGSKKRDNSDEYMTGSKETVSSISHEFGANLANSADILRNDDMAAEKRNPSNLGEVLQSEDQNTVHDLSYETGSDEDGSLQEGKLGRRDSASETSVLDTESAMEITPDDVVGMIGQKHFWKARRAIMNQQRVFAVQVFELHRLIKVQRLIAASPHLLHDDDAYLDKPIKPLSGKKRPLDSVVEDPNLTTSASDMKGGSERSAENTVEKPPSSSAQTWVPPQSFGPSGFVAKNDHNIARPSYFSNPPPQGHQWLMPVMSPTEGLVYKPCQAPGFQGSGSFLAPVYGFPAPLLPQYQIPAFPPYGPHGYFPNYSMPIMSSVPFSGSSFEQTHPSARDSASTTPAQIDETVPDGLGQRTDEEVEAPGGSSSGSSLHPFFRASSLVANGSNSGHQAAEAELGTRVIKVVPHNGVYASESAARIFKSIQEERKQYDSV